MKLEAAIAADYSNIAGMVVRKDGETDDKIAYAFSDATIIAAQSMYAEKFIAPAGSGSWSKQGLLVKAGSDFDYLLEIVNETAAVHTASATRISSAHPAAARNSRSACAAPSRRRRAIRSITPRATLSTPIPWRRW